MHRPRELARSPVRTRRRRLPTTPPTPSSAPRSSRSSRASAGRATASPPSTRCSTWRRSGPPVRMPTAPRLPSLRATGAGSCASSSPSTATTARNSTRSGSGTSGTRSRGATRRARRARWVISRRDAARLKLSTRARASGRRYEHPVRGVGDLERATREAATRKRDQRVNDTHPMMTHYLQKRVAAAKFYNASATAARHCGRSWRSRSRLRIEVGGRGWRTR